MYQFININNGKQFSIIINFIPREGNLLQLDNQLIKIVDIDYLNNKIFFSDELISL